MMATDAQDKLMSVREIAEGYGMSRQNIYQLCKKGKLASEKTYWGLMVRRSDVERYLATSHAGRPRIWVAVTSSRVWVDPWLPVTMGLNRGRVFSEAVELILAGGAPWDEDSKTYTENLKLVSKTVALRKYRIKFTPREIPAEDVMNVPIIPWVE